MYLRAVIGRKGHTEYGVATIPFPIEMDSYEHNLDLLEAMEIGDTLKADCYIEEIESDVPVLKLLEGQEVNLDELDYLVKRLDSFDKNEIAQFQAASHKLGLTNIRDLINLTFCCQQATVIADFSDLETIGRRHFVITHAGATQDELDDLDGEETARLLIDSGAGVVTPYGVLYENGMKLEQLYQGRVFPHFSYTPPLLTLELLPNEQGQADTFLDLPASDSQIARALIRAGISQDVWCGFHVDVNNLPDSVRNVLAFEREYLADLNDMLPKFKALQEATECTGLDQLMELTDQVDDYFFEPDKRSVEDVAMDDLQCTVGGEDSELMAKYMNLTGYGKALLERENGVVTHYGMLERKDGQPIQAQAEQEEQGPSQGGMEMM